MNEIITIDCNACSVPIQMETVWKKPLLSTSNLFRLPWEVYPFKDITIIRQHLKLIGTHLQIIEAKNDYEAILPLKACLKVCAVFFVLRGSIKFFGNSTEEQNQILSSCFSLIYFPYGRTDLTLPPGLHNFLIVSLEYDWPLSFPNIADTFYPLIECWKKNFPSVFVLPFCETPFKLKRILVKIRRIAILDFKESLDILIYISNCIKLYHEQNTSKSLVSERELLKIGKKLLIYLQENYMIDERCRLALVAQQFGISTFILQRSCNIIYGTTFFQLLTQIRIEKSCKLLEHTKMEINQIAIEVGYANPSAFGKSFKRIKNLSASRYRKNQTGNGD
ncbi:AraC family transcriptional regulator [Sphingobacterium sp.]|uniref:helix-turn-helix domain-containing protein n=1 Tax=Sphingobacterium sp. TaxID=341027 RepID=UPI0031D246F2